MPMPKSARNANSMRYEVENPPMKAKSEYQRIENISGNLRPQRSAAVPEADPADQPEHQRHRAQRPGQRGVDGEAALNIDEQERDDGEVEAVEQPAEISGKKCTPLRWSDLAPPFQEGHEAASLPESDPFAPAL